MESLPRYRSHAENHSAISGFARQDDHTRLSYEQGQGCLGVSTEGHVWKDHPPSLGLGAVNLIGCIRQFLRCFPTCRGGLLSLEESSGSIALFQTRSGRSTKTASRLRSPSSLPLRTKKQKAAFSNAHSLGGRGVFGSRPPLRKSAFPSPHKKQLMLPLIFAILRSQAARKARSAERNISW